MSKYLSIQIIFLTFATWIVGSSYPMTRGKSVAPSTLSMTDVTKKTDNMSMTKVPLSVIKERFENKHGGKYLYTLVNDDNYKTQKSIIPIICKEHGVFWRSVGKHLLGGGCSKCAYRKISKSLRGVPQPNKRTLVFGVGINDYEGVVRTNGVTLYSYVCWQDMLQRCYIDSYYEKAPTYRGCSVCEEWKYFSVFKRFFDENYVDGYHLDKDILVKGNKVYSPDTCCFVPREINTLFVKKNANRGTLPIGVSIAYGKYKAQIKRYGRTYSLGVYDSSEEAFAAYKVAKEAHIKEVAEKYYREGKITERVYNALINYKVEITD